MKKILSIISVMASFIAYADAPNCPAVVPPPADGIGNYTHVILVSYYGWVDQNTRSEYPTYTVSHSGYMLAGGTVRAMSEGHPMAHQWYFDGRLHSTCGELPVWRIFSDGFEDGDADRWSNALMASVPAVPAVPD